uniref:Procollagen C-endopeptidase enhancer a n=1 Tax=Lepisosteus oculatus TaxID=7918 RepID=W5N761_LEPOC
PMKSSMFLRVLSGASVIVLVLLGCAGAQSQTTQRSNFTRPVFNCGGELIADSGFVGSEGFPSYYKPDRKCTWYITVPEGHVVMLSFRVFDLEADPQCRFDYVEVYNGHSYTAQRLGRFCGTFRPGALISTSHRMMVEMVSDSGTGGRGFLGYFNGGKPHVDEHQFCGGKLTKSQGSVKTPNWPEKDYPAGISCSWHIIVESNMVIEVTFDKFDLEHDSYCRYDYVAFFNGGESDDSRRIGKYCGDIAPGTIVSNGNELLVQFVSDLSVTSDGFMATYTSIPRGSKPSTVAGEENGLGPQLVPESAAKPPSKPGPKPPAKPAVTKPVKPKPTLSGAANPLCAQGCKRTATIQSSFCSSEFGEEPLVFSLSALGFTFSELCRLDPQMTVLPKDWQLVSACKKCPLIRRGANYILMGQVDDEGRGLLSPNSFTLLYKAPHQKMLTNLNSKPC